MKKRCYKEKCREPVIGLAVLVPAAGDRNAVTADVCEEHAAARARRGVEIIRNKETTKR